MTLLLITVLLSWSAVSAAMLVWTMASANKERESMRSQHLQQIASLRSETQCLTEALVRQSGGTYISPITRNQQVKAGEPTQKWYGKKAEGLGATNG